MPSTPDRGSDSSPLERGLAALKQKQYRQAIALLEPVAASQPDHTARLKAKMALVKAYDRAGQSDRAIALCETLTRHPSEKVRTRATQILEQLRRRQPPVSTGFVPFDPTLQPPKVESTANRQPPPPPTKPENPPVYVRLQKQQGQPTFAPPTTEEEPAPEVAEPEPPPVATATPDTDISPPQYQWKQAGRAAIGWRRLGKLKLTRFRIEQFLTVFVLLWLSPRLVEFLLETTNHILRQLPFVKPIQFFYRDPSRWVYLTLGILFVASPWLLDALLKFCYGQQVFPRTQLLQSSQEASRILQTYCRNRNWKFPALRVLPTAAPIAMTYGCWPRFVRICVSQGLLDTLTEDELAAIYAREIASVGNWDFLAMSFATVLTQIPYLIYCQFADWGENGFDRLQRDSLPRWVPDFAPSLLKPPAKIFRILAFPISAAAYGIYQILRFPALWVSRRRVYYNDRLACNLTGNPNGLTRALSKMAVGMAAAIAAEGKTDTLLEGFDLLTPVGYRQAMTVGSLARRGDFESLFIWDLQNPHRKWLEIPNSHPALGDRLLILSYYAQFWKLDQELNLESPAPSKSRGDREKLAIQGAPYFGLPAGVAIGLAVWLMGAIFGLIGFWQLEWLFGDRWILYGCIPIGCSLGIFLRNNAFFPEIKPAKTAIDPDLRELFCDPRTLPIDSKPICVQGELIGRGGIDNIMGQDLILKTAGGLVRLHYVPPLTPLANFWLKSPHPKDLIGRPVKVTGWWRRGATPWIDVERLQSVEKRLELYGGHPLWSVILAIAIALWGASLISRGGF